MRFRLKLMVGALVIGLPAAAGAQDTTTTEEAAPPEATTQQQPAETPAAETSAKPADAAAAQPADASAAQPAQQAAAVATKKAAKEDLKVDAAVLDPKGGAVGKIEKVTATGAVVSTGSARVELALDSFGVGDKGLVIGRTKAELEAAAKAKEPKASDPAAKEEKPKDDKPTDKK